MTRVDDTRKIEDIQRVARTLNVNRLSLDEYLGNGGIYPREVIDDWETAGFASLCELAGIKDKQNA